MEKEGFAMLAELFPNLSTLSFSYNDMVEKELKDIAKFSNLTSLGLSIIDIVGMEYEKSRKSFSSILSKLSNLGFNWKESRIQRTRHHL